MTTIVARLAAATPNTSLPSTIAITQAATITIPTIIDIVLALQCIGALSSRIAPEAAKPSHVQPLPSMPRNVPPVTSPSGACVVKFVEPISSPRMPPASSTTPMMATGPLASDTPLVRSMVCSFLRSLGTMVPASARADAPCLSAGGRSDGASCGSRRRPLRSR
jgi:hypothetical protein